MTERMHGVSRKLWIKLVRSTPDQEDLCIVSDMKFQIFCV